MKRMFILFLIIGWIGFLMLADPARASLSMPFGDGTITFQGYLENFSGLRVGSEGEGKVAIFRNTFQPEFLYTFGDGNSLFISGRFVKETGYELEKGTRAALGLEALPDDYYDETDFEPWELHLDMNFGDKVRLITGKQYIIWGETDVFRMLDVINPADGSWDPPAMVPLEEKRIPIYAGRCVWNISPTTNFEFVFVPMIDKEENRVDKSAPDGGRWAVHPEGRVSASVLYATNFPQMGPDMGAAGFIPGVTPVETSVTTQYPENSLDEARVGARLSFQVGKWDLALMDYYTHQSTRPVVFYDGTTAEQRSVLNPDGSITTATYIIPHFSKRYPRQNILGLSFNYFEKHFTKGVIKGEVAYYYDKHYQTKEQTPEGMDGVKEIDTLSYSLAWEKNCFIPWLHTIVGDDPTQTWTVSVQMFQDVILGDSDDLTTGKWLTPVHKVNTMWTVKAFSDYFYATWKPTIIAGYDPRGNGLWHVKLKWMPPWSEKYYVEASYLGFWGNDRYENLGLFDDKDSVLLRIRYMW